MWRKIIVSILSLLFVLLYMICGINPSYLFFLTPFVFLFVFYLFILGDHVSVSVTIGFTLFLIGYVGYQTSNLIFFPLVFILAVATWATYIYTQHWNQNVKEIEEKEQLVKKEAEAVRERHRARMDSLKHLEQRVVGLVHLFEIARDFNECIDFSEMLSVLDQKIAPEFTFVRGTVILIEPASQSDKRVSRSLSFGLKKREDEVLCDQFASECLRILALSCEENETSKKQVFVPQTIGADEKSDLASYQVVFPLWLFPLTAEHKLIAILAIEGGIANDFQRFEVLASQLALQVKKFRLYETVKQTSIMDGLTNVFVRRHFLERFQEELKRAFRYQFPLSVLMVDVDHFKSYNDKFGHLVGDKTLREVAQVIRENVRRVDVIGRYGGEEFIIAAPEIEKKRGLELAERIRSAVARKQFHLYDENTQVTVSIGISSFPEDVQDKPLNEFSEIYIPLLVQRADQALYRAKEGGRNRVVVYG